MGPDPLAHDEAPQRPDGGERRQARAASEIDGRKVREQGPVEAVDRARPQSDVGAPCMRSYARKVSGPPMSRPSGARFDRDRR